jgi:hypothetical protein
MRILSAIVETTANNVATYVDPALGQEILDVTQRQRVLHVHHHDQTDHFW